MNRLKIILMFVAAVTLFGYSEAAAQPPGGASGLVAREGKDVGFRWTPVAGATWYYLWINDSTNTTRHNRWYTAAELECGVSPGVCKIGLTLDAAPGQMMWWVQTYGAGGYGPWTAAQLFTPGPLSAVVNGATGALVRGNAVSAQHLGTGNYEVIFGRDVTSCTYNINPSGLTFETPIGFASATRRSLNANGVFVETRNPANVAADLSFHLTVVCGATQ